jgi:hypothetical protein
MTGAVYSPKQSLVHGRSVDDRSGGSQDDTPSKGPKKKPSASQSAGILIKKSRMAPKPEDPRIKELQRKFKKVVPDGEPDNGMSPFEVPPDSPFEAGKALPRRPIMEFHERDDRVSGTALMHQYLSETGPGHKGFEKLSPSERRKINKDLRAAGFDGNSRFRSMGAAMGAAARVMERHGIEMDEPVTADHFRHNPGKMAIHIAHSNAEEPMAPKRIMNSMFSAHWTEMRSGFEVIAQMS